MPEDDIPCTGFKDHPCRLGLPARFDRGNDCLLCPSCNHRLNRYLEYQMLQFIKGEADAEV